MPIFARALIIAAIMVGIITITDDTIDTAPAPSPTTALPNLFFAMAVTMARRANITDMIAKTKGITSVAIEQITITTTNGMIKTIANDNPNNKSRRIVPYKR